MVNWNDPTQASVIALVASFAIFFGSLLLLKPKCLRKKDDEDKISYPLLITLSAAFALVVAVIALLTVAGRSKKNTSTIRTMDNYFY